MDRSAVGEPGALLEREHELERIRAALRAAGRQAGETLIIEGAAGLGKSRLLAEARAAASEMGIRLLTALASDIEQGFPFGVMRQLFERALTAPLASASYCHCKRCQRRSGAAASANAHPAPRTFRIVDGEDRLRVWKPESGGEKWFCGNCGSSLFGHNPSHPEPIGIRMGAFDADPKIRPTSRQFVAYAAPWETIPDDGLPRYSESRHAQP